ncbi:hypothetical protein CDL15_Pgr018332 [Punica granatum]|uniref:Uncharacterized protein n=1 Tax=Punica granatum TaxID=22663 RepID=A0A218WHZ6_PUNGR|nr:hypothetical protein CDL15_Pgr018332 [Punica granatum]PKI76165.1 hypothetical protein CRG98_003526 [Punica granatum]
MRCLNSFTSAEASSISRTSLSPSIGVTLQEEGARIGIPKMPVKTVWKRTETWSKKGKGHPSPWKKVRSTFTPGFFKKREHGNGVGMVPGSSEPVSSSVENLGVARNGGNQKSPKTCRKMLLSLPALFDKKLVLHSIKNRIRRDESSRINALTHRVIRGAKAKARRISTACDMISSRRTSPRRASRAPIRVQTNRKKTRMPGPVGKEIKGRQANEVIEEFELCRKRILMGRKCKPLNSSGSLQYDENGILLPELLP